MVLPAITCDVQSLEGPGGVVDAAAGADAAGRALSARR